MSIDYVVGEVGFGPSFASNPVDNEIIKELRQENAKLIKHRNILRRALERCAALNEEVSNEKHEALLQTAP